MRLGLLPGQQRLLAKTMRKARAFDRFRKRTRRHFVFGGLLAAAASAGSFVAGARIGTSDRAHEPDAPTDPRLAWLRALARGPLEELERREMHLVSAVEQGVLDDTLAYGVQRLVAVSLTNPGNQVLRARLTRLLQRGEHLPDHLRSSLQRLTASKR